jgi:hypothetical protein
MRQKFMRYALLPLGIILVLSLAACVGGLKPAGTGPAVQWYNVYGGSQSDVGRSVQQTTDGGYILFGTTKSYGEGGQDFWLIKTDAHGNKLWDKTFGGEKDDGGWSAIQIKDGGYILCGGTFSSGAGGQDAWLIKTDTKGNKLWDKTFGGSESDYFYSVQQTTEGGYILCGGTKSQASGNKEMWLVKTDADGSKLWDKTFSGKGAALGASVWQTADGGYIVCGGTMSMAASKAGYDWQELLLVKTDASGNKDWDFMIKDEEHDEYLGDYMGWSAQQTADGGYIACGECSLASPDVLLIKIDTDGNKLWEKKYGEEDKNEAGSSVWQTTDGGYIICGSALSRKISSDKSRSQVVLLIKTEADGNKLWDETFGGKKPAIGSSVQQTADGGYIVCGATIRPVYGGSDFLLLKIAPDK